MRVVSALTERRTVNGQVAHEGASRFISTERTSCRSLSLFLSKKAAKSYPRTSRRKSYVERSVLSLPTLPVSTDHFAAEYLAKTSLSICPDRMTAQGR